MTCRVRETLEPRADVAVIVNDLEVQQLEEPLLVGNEDALEASFWPILDLVACLAKKSKEAFGRINLL
jgi:hypothetical protein